MTKKELREIYRDKRNALTIAEKAKLDDLLLIQFQKTDLPFIKTLLSYWPIEENKEPDAHLFTDYLEFKNPELIIAYPKTDFIINEMDAIVTNEETDFLKNEYNIYEPEEGNRMAADEIDMILVPLLTFDKKGFRVGYGKGFYDKYLADCRKDCIKAGFSYFEPVDEIEDLDKFDIKLNYCITPHAIFTF